jgi:hypothetical protein
MRSSCFTRRRAAGGIVLLAGLALLAPVPPAAAQTNHWWTIWPPPIEGSVTPPVWPRAGFGASVSLSGTRLVVGSPQDSRGALGSGAAYVYELVGGEWVLRGSLFAPEPRAGDAFGTAVAIDGDLIVVGAPGDDFVTDDTGAIVASAPDRGAAHAFQWDGAGWRYIGRIEPALEVGDSGAGMRFGASVALGGGVVVGSPGYGSAAGESAGGAWWGGVSAAGPATQTLYRLVEPEGFSAPHRHAGAAVAVRSHFYGCYRVCFTVTAAIVGAPGAPGFSAVSQGAAFAYTWRAEVLAPPASLPADAGMGSSVALLRADVPQEYAIGVPRGTSFFVGAGGTSWLKPVQRPAPAQPVEQAGYGTSIAFLDGQTTLLGPANNNLSYPRDPIIVFRRHSDETWSEAHALPDPGDGSAAGTDSFGAAMSVSGSLVAVGAPAVPFALWRGSGSVYVFDYATLDLDRDQLPDAWEERFGLDTSDATGDNGANGDPDNDGRTNFEEHAAGTHPRNLASATRYFAEGTTNTFPGGRFLTGITVANAGDAPAHVLVRMLGRDGSAHAETRLLPTGASVGFSPTEAGLEFSTVIESDQPIAAERRVSWISGDGVLGVHAERAIERPATTWYFAEGATHSGMQVFYLLQNPSPVPVTVQVSYLRSDGDTVEKDHVLPPSSRTTIWANVEEFPSGSGRTVLASAEFGATFTASDGAEVIAERAMYLLRPEGGFGAGHASAGATAPATRWLFAEGATGSFFDEFILIANPGDAPTEVSITYALTDGRTFTRHATIAPHSRYNAWVDVESFDNGITFPLADVSHSTVVEATNGMGVVAERSMWFPGPTAATWHEAHNTFGSTETGTLWVAPHVRSDSPDYLLLLNPNPAPVRVRLTMTTGYWTEMVERWWEFDLLPTSRHTVLVRDLGAVVVGVPARVEVVSDPTLPISAELATYQEGRYGEPWATGACRLLTRLRE